MFKQSPSGGGTFAEDQLERQVAEQSREMARIDPDLLLKGKQQAHANHLAE